MSGEPMRSLSREELELLTTVVAKHRPDLRSLLAKSEDLTRPEAEELVATIGEEVSNVADDDAWELNSYGSRLERLLDAVNRHRLP